MIPVYTTIEDFEACHTTMRSAGSSIAFVPTLGALHRGHLALMQLAQTIADRVVVSIFVNPKQFNEPADLAKYPRPLQQDIHLLNQQGIDVLFLPNSHVIYPPDQKVGVDVDLSHLTTHLEGKHRPGHFDGVITVVHRLIDIIKPDFLVMGQKDFQQMTIIRAMIDALRLPVELIAHPTVREPDGLALSSRNARLTKEARKKANQIYRLLLQARDLKDRFTPRQVVTRCISDLDTTVFQLDYFDIVDIHTLHPISEWQDDDENLICVAAWLGNVRLIDNLVI